MSRELWPRLVVRRTRYYAVLYTYISQCLSLNCRANSLITLFDGIVPGTTPQQERGTTVCSEQLRAALVKSRIFT